MYFDYDEYFDEFLNLYENDPEIQRDKTAVSRFLKHKYNIQKSLDAIRKAYSTRLDNHYADKEIVEKLLNWQIKTLKRHG